VLISHQTEALAEQRQHELLESARRIRQGRGSDVRARARHRLRFLRAITNITGR
jgi:hypothetical protein